jgi:hypothetical protein
MGRKLLVAALALVGLLCAAGVGVAAYLVSRDSVAVPVTQLQPKPRELTPITQRSRNRPRATTTRRVPPPPPPTTVEDHGGHGGSSGPGGGGGGGHGGGDD